LGGRERKLAEVSGGSLSWSPDGKSIAFADRKSPNEPWSIWSLSVETLEKEQVTVPGVDYYGDGGPVFSPDGRYVAFIRRIELSRPALYVMQLPRGKPELLTDYNYPLQPCWTPDSSEIVFTTHPDTGEIALWRISVSGGEPRRVPVRGERVSSPTVSRNRLAYVSESGNVDIWRLELTKNRDIQPSSEPLLSWSSNDSNPSISPDGSRIAFGSDSSGSAEIWICNGDGSKPIKLTDMKTGSTGSPSWSPDGKNVSFDSTKSGNFDIYVVSAEGGPVRRITADPTDEVIPRWSRDGRWIYFGSNRGGGWQIWKVPADAGKAIQITKDKGVSVRESVDGFVYYCSGFYRLVNGNMWRTPISGGTETLVLDRVFPAHSWDLTERGIYFIDRNAKPVATICLYDLATRRVRSLAPVSGDPGYRIDIGLSVSPQEEWLLYSGGIFTSNIMMIDNFR
jgi:Tol biopolymer transport system component